jgi:hypothetical protein
MMGAHRAEVLHHLLRLLRLLRLPAAPACFACLLSLPAASVAPVSVPQHLWWCTQRTRENATKAGKINRREFWPCPYTYGCA